MFFVFAYVDIAWDARDLPVPRGVHGHVCEHAEARGQERGRGRRDLRARAGAAVVTAVADPLTVEEDLRRLTPTGAGVAACEVQSVLVGQLSAGERALVRTARPVRRAEFASGRSCAHRALSAIGADLDTIGRGGRRQPIWPAGVCGSISHAGGLAAAVVARITPSVIGIGLDVERVDRLVPELWSHVLTSSESARCRASTAPLAERDGRLQRQRGGVQSHVPVVGHRDRVPGRARPDAGAGTVEIPSLGASVPVRQGETGAFVVSLAIVASPAPRVRLSRQSRFAAAGRSGAAPREARRRELRAARRYAAP